VSSSPSCPFAPSSSVLICSRGRVSFTSSEEVVASGVIVFELDDSSFFGMPGEPLEPLESPPNELERAALIEATVKEKGEVAGEKEGFKRARQLFTCCWAEIEGSSRRALMNLSGGSCIKISRAL